MGYAGLWIASDYVLAMTWFGELKIENEANASLIESGKLKIENEANAIFGCAFF
jgi:hypothetical protein